MPVRSHWSRLLLSEGSLILVSRRFTSSAALSLTSDAICAIGAAAGGAGTGTLAVSNAEPLAANARKVDLASGFTESQYHNCSGVRERESNAWSLPKFAVIAS